MIRVLRQLCAPGLLAAGWLCNAPGALAAPPSEAGYAIITMPESGRQFISGAVLALARTSDGQLIVGSNQLAVFDGHSWQRIIVPGVTRFLSLNADRRKGDDPLVRVWFAAHGALGYIDRHGTGEWLVTNLNAPLAAAGQTDLSDIVRVEPDGDGGAVFLSRSRVLWWRDHTFRIWELPNTSRLYSFVYQGALHICQPGFGLFRMTEDGPRLRITEADLPDGQPLVDMIDVPGGDVLVISSDEQLYLRTSGHWRPVPETSRHLKGGRLIRALRVNDNVIALGTAYGGVVLVRNDGSLIRLVNVHSGLPDDTTDKILQDGEDGLWISTGSGLVRMAGAGQASLFDQRNWLAYGDIRRVLHGAGRSWVLTSRRVYGLTPVSATEPARLTRLEPYWSQLRDGVVRDDILWLAGNGGLWRVEDGVAEREPSVSADTYAVLAANWMPGGLIYATRRELHLLTPQPNGWTSAPLGQTLDSPVHSALLDRSGRLWVGTREGSVLVYEWDSASARLRSVAHYRPGRELPSGGQTPVLAPWGEGMAILSRSGILVCSGAQAPAVPQPGLEGFVVDHAVELPDGALLMSVQHRDLGSAAPQALIKVRPVEKSANAVWEPVLMPGLDRVGPVTSLSLTGTPGKRVLWIGGENALLRFEDLALAPARPAPAVQLRAVQSNSQPRASLRPREKQLFGSDTTQVTFSYSAGADWEGAYYSTRLLGVDDNWSPAQISPQRDFAGLPPGGYEFQVRAIDRFGRPGPLTAYGFQLEAPWYRRPWARALWVTAVALIIAAAVRWRLRQLHRQAARLNQLVKERTRELSLSNTARAEFLDSLSHELRRPLKGLSALIRQLEGSGLTPMQRKHAHLLRLGTESLTRVCDEVLAYSTLEYGAVTPRARRFQLRAVLAIAAEDGAPDGHAPVVRYPAGFIDGFVGDDRMIATIVTNFVANARRHAAGAPAEISVSCEDDPAGAAEWLIEVTDGGPGVPPEEQELIFKRFTRGSRARETRVPGTGIGLATCRLLARLLGGSVGVESPAERAREARWPGPGATFFLSVPLSRAPGRPDAHEDAFAPPEPAAPAVATGPSELSAPWDARVSG